MYSIEFAHLLFAAASEVDVIAKNLCKIFKPAAPRENINHYKSVLLSALPHLTAFEVFVPRYGLILTPWENWSMGKNPLWWGSYNKVKHERDTHFEDATLQHALNAMGALFILNFYYYSYSLATGAAPLSAPDTTEQLQPVATLFRFRENYYYTQMVCERPLGEL